VREYPDGTLAIFHGPRLIARYTSQAGPINSGPQKARRVTRFDAAAAGLWICGQRKTRVAHKLHKPATAKLKRTTDVLPKPDNLKSYRQGRAAT
jgi:hypothetical protein